MKMKKLERPIEVKESKLTPTERFEKIQKELLHGPKTYIDDDKVEVTMSANDTILTIERKKDENPKIHTVFRFACDYHWNGYAWWYVDYLEMDRDNSNYDKLDRFNSFMHPITEDDALDALKKIEERMWKLKEYEIKENSKKEQEKTEARRKFLDYAEQPFKKEDAKDVEKIEEDFFNQA